jgi:hypothetical protein
MKTNTKILYNRLYNMSNSIHINMNLSSNINNLGLTEKYIASLSTKEKKGYEIAKSHLGSSFQIEKSIGFKEFVKRLESSSAAVSISSP